MSNPSVIELSRKKTSMGDFVVEDNIGEAIHIHLDEFRLDLTIQNLNMLADECRRALNELISVEGFECNMLDASFLVDIAEFLPDLEEIVHKEIEIKNLIIDTELFGCIPIYKNIKHSRVVKALNGNKKEDNNRVQNNNFGVSNNQRTLSIYNSIKDTGYNCNQNRVVLFNNKLNIMDGQHRAAVMYYLGTETTIPVLIMKFKNLKHSVVSYPSLYYLTHWDLQRIKKLARIVYRSVKRKYNIACYKVKFKIWLIVNRKNMK